MPLFKIAFLEFRELRQMCEQTPFQWLIAMHRNREPYRTTQIAVDVMAPVDTKEIPSVALDDLGKLVARKLFQTIISTTRSFPVAFGALTSTERQPSTAS